MVDELDGDRISYERPANELYGNFGPEQLDRAPDLITSGQMIGGRGYLEVVSWSQARVRVRVGMQVFPRGYNLSVFCGSRLRGISPFKKVRG